MSSLHHDESSSSSFSVSSLEDDKSLQFEPTRDNLTEGLLNLVKPTLETIDASVEKTREAQDHLRKQIEDLASQLEKISGKEGGSCPIPLDSYIDKLQNSKKRIIVVSSILQGAQDRLNRIHQLSMKEKNKLRLLLDPSEQ